MSDHPTATKITCRSCKQAKTIIRRAKGRPRLYCDDCGDIRRMYRQRGYARLRYAEERSTA